MEETNAMNSGSMNAWMVILLTASLTMVGDYFLKMASLQPKLINKWFWAGCLAFALTSLGWAWTMRYMKLATLGVAYSITTVVFSAALGFAVFNESLSKLEVLGLVMALASIILLARFAD